MTRAALLLLLTLVLATGALAFKSRDEVVPPDPASDGHRLQWRQLPTRAWIDVGTVQPLSDQFHPQHDSGNTSFPGVDWDLTGTVAGFGEWRAFAVRGGLDSTTPSNVIDLGSPGPPPAPTLLSALAVVALLRRWIRRR